MFFRHIGRPTRQPSSHAKRRIAGSCNDRGSRRRGASGGCHCCAYLVARAWCADSVSGLARPGLTSFHRANAGRNSCWHTRNRSRRSEEPPPFWPQPSSRLPTRRFARIFRRFGRSKLTPCSLPNFRSERRKSFPRSEPDWHVAKRSGRFEPDRRDCTELGAESSEGMREGDQAFARGQSGSVADRNRLRTGSRRA